METTGEGTMENLLADVKQKATDQLTV